MAIVHLFGNQADIHAMRAAANGVAPENTVSEKTAGDSVRTNSNTDPITTMGRLMSEGYKVGYESFKRNGGDVIEMAARPA